jgi:hypothetical protein
MTSIAGRNEGMMPIRRAIRGILGGGFCPLRCAVVAMIVAGFGVSVGVANAAPPSPDVVASDLAHLSPDIHWPASFSPESADMFSHNEIMIHADCSIVWRHLVAAPKWPNWYPNARDVQLPDGNQGVLQADTKFDWITFGVHIDSTVHEYVPDRRLGWFSERPGVRAYHTWLLVPAAEGCQVVTEEETKGPAAITGRKSNPGALHAGHELWLTRLKALSER